MILQSLNQLYERLAKDPSYGLPTPGYSVQKVTFCIVLHPDGRFHVIEDARETVSETNKKGVTKTRQVPRQMLVPDGGARTRGVKAYTFCDTSSYLLGFNEGEGQDSHVDKCFEASKSLHVSAASEIGVPAAIAVASFYQSWSSENCNSYSAELNGFASTGFGVFRIVGTNCYVHDIPEIRAWWLQSYLCKNPSGVIAQCLVTGEITSIARLAEPSIKGVAGAPKGGKLASFNDPAYESYGKEQTFNSPVSEQATFQYCNALNALLSGRQSRRHRITIGDATTVFWTERETVAESLFAKFLGGDTAENESPGDDPVMHARLEAFLSVLRKGGGTLPAELGDPDTKFYILGLSGNVTRLSVRFWHIGTIAQMIGRLRSHFDALSIDPQYESDSTFPSAVRLLDQTAPYRHGKVDRDSIPPLLGGQLVQSILQGTPYPLTLYNCVLNRLRVLEKDQHGKSRERVSYLKASILKAVLTRNYHYIIPMSLDTTRTEPAYLLGRLFAALEKTQEDAIPGINATIRDRFYGSASATPGAVFPRLLRTYQHHLSKLEGGQKVNRDRLVQAIHGMLASFPTHLGLEDQGLFAIGYYHQRQDFFTKKDKPETTTEQ
jgi:CRISPR-associated protein Csd1